MINPVVPIMIAMLKLKDKGRALVAQKQNHTGLLSARAKHNRKGRRWAETPMPAPPSKRRKVAPGKTAPVQEVTFDLNARHEFLTGFRKRKQQRAKHAQEVAERKAREEKNEHRKKVRLVLSFCYSILFHCLSGWGIVLLNGLIAYAESNMNILRCWLTWDYLSVLNRYAKSVKRSSKMPWYSTANGWTK